MTITPTAIKELRERTGAGMMECKKVLVESKGDLEAAIVAMRKAGQTKASQKAGRVAAEGAVITEVSEDASKAVVVEVNSETDFVARNEKFKCFAEQVAACALTSWCLDVNVLASLPLRKESDQTVEEGRLNLVSQLGENIQIRRISGLEAKKPGTFLVSYQHGGRIGVLAQILGGTLELAKDIAMHIAASNPEVIDANEVSKSRIEKEKEIFKAQAESLGKPASVVEKIVDSQVKNFINEISLLGQEFVKIPDKTVETILKGHQASVIKFIRFELGEGIAKNKK